MNKMKGLQMIGSLCKLSQALSGSDVRELRMFME